MVIMGFELQYERFCQGIVALSCMVCNTTKHQWPEDFPDRIARCELVTFYQIVTTCLDGIQTSPSEFAQPNIQKLLHFISFLIAHLQDSS